MDYFFHWNGLSASDFRIQHVVRLNIVAFPLTSTAVHLEASCITARRPAAAAATIAKYIIDHMKGWKRSRTDLKKKELLACPGCILFIVFQISSWDCFIGVALLCLINIADNPKKPLWCKKFVDQWPSSKMCKRHCVQRVAVAEKEGKM